MRYNFTISHVLGKNLVIADTLSRAPIGGPEKEDRAFEDETSAYVNYLVDSVPATEQKLAVIRESQEANKECQEVGSIKLT